MAIGHADWGQAAQSTLVGSQPDAGEVAARLFSPVSLSRSGKVIWLTSFDEGLAAVKSAASGPGSSVAAVTAKTYQGANAVLLTSGSDADDLAYVEKFIPLLPQSTVGLEFLYLVDGPYDRIEAIIRMQSGGLYPSFKVVLDRTGNRTYIVDGVLGNVLLSPANLPYELDYLYHRVKLVADLATGMFVRLWLDGELYDLSAYVNADLGVSTGQMLEILVVLYGRAGFNDDLRLDNMIVTVEEP